MRAAYFVVRARRAPSPIAKGVMLDRGYRLTLYPDEFPAHAVLAGKIRRSQAWDETSDPGTPELEAAEPKTETRLLPHQVQAINRIRQMNKVSGDPT